MLAPDLPSLITCPPMLYRTLKTKNRKSPYLFRIGSGPLAKSSENITAYPQDAPVTKRHKSESICGFCLKQWHNLLPRGLI